MKTTFLLSSANSWRLLASFMKSVSSRNVDHNSSTTSRRSSICVSFIKREICFATERITSMSCAITARTPGRCTFTATTSPLTSPALCTCASEALPNGFGSIERKISSNLLPYTSFNAASVSSNGIGSQSI